MDTWKMTHFNEFFFQEFSLPIGSFCGNDWEQPGGEKVVKRIFFKYVTMIEVLSFSLFIHSFVQNTFIIINIMYFDCMDCGNAFSFQLPSCYSKYMRFVLGANNHLKS